MAQRGDVRELPQTGSGFWRSLFSPEIAEGIASGSLLTDPLHCDTPVLLHAEIAAVYSGYRVAGDFYEFLRVGSSRMFFVLLDIAGLRADTRAVLVAVQKTFRELAPELLSGDDINETIAMIELCNAMNLTILRSGLRSCPGFIGCYNDELGTVCYSNAGHPPGLLRDASGITLLGATGLPLGLFSHTTQSATTCHLVPGSALLLISRGIIEADRDGVEFGLDGVQERLKEFNSEIYGAQELCSGVLQEARDYMVGRPAENDLTTLALIRSTSSFCA